MAKKSLMNHEMRRPCVGIVLLFLACWLMGAAFADEPKSMSQSGPTASREFVTHHRLDIGKEPLNYTAIAG